MTRAHRARAVVLSAIILVSMVAGGTVVSGTSDVEDEATETTADSITQESPAEHSIEYGTNLSKAVSAVSTSDGPSSATADGGGSSAVTAQNVVIRNKIASDDASLSELSAEDPVRLQVQLSDSADVDETVAEIEAVGAVLRQFEDIGYASVRIQLGDVPRVERMDGVEAVRLEPTATRAAGDAQQVTPLNESASREEPSRAWESMNSYSDADLLHRLGYNGSGVTVAVIDTGVTETDAVSGKIVDQRDFTTGTRSDAFDPRGTDPTDYFGHGSNVAGIIAASDTTVEAENRTKLASGDPISTSDSKTYETEGVAPGANLINAKVFQLLETNSGGPVTETVGTDQTEQVDITGFDQNARYLRVEAEWADPSDNVTVELVDANGNVVDSVYDGNGYELSPQTTTSGNKAVLHLNTTGGMIANPDIDAIRITGDSVNGETDVNVTYRQFSDLAYSGDIAEAIEWSTTGTDAGDRASPTADVVSTSIAASGSQPAREAAIEQAVENGSLYVSSAGNAGEDTTVSPIKQRDDVITVGAIDRDGSIAEFSQPGPTENKPDLVAPGVAIPSAGAPDRLPAVAGFDNNGTVKSGTSMATPYVSGSAALYIDAYRDMHETNPSPEEIRAALTAGAIDSREDPAFNSANGQLENFSAEPTDLPLADSRDDRYGAGMVNPYNSFVAFVASGEGDETVAVDTDGLTTVPPADQSARDARPQKAALIWVDEASDYGLSSSTAGSASGPGAERIVVETPSGQRTTYGISETASGSDEWAFGVTAPILDEQSQGWSGDGYEVTAEPGQSLEQNESAAYAVPVDRTLANGAYADDIGPIRVQSYENGSGDLDLFLYDGNGSLESKSTVDEPDVEQVIGDNQTATQGAASKVVFASNFSSGRSDFTAVHNYPLEPLPSEAGVTVTDSVAGNASDPGSVALEFTVETADRPYSYGGFGQPDESHVEVGVGNQTVNKLSLSRVNGRQDKYRVEFVAPVQQTTGDYDVSVTFTDEKYGTSHTAETTAANAIEYTEGGGATGSTATSIIIDESGSMGGDKIQNAKQSAKEYVSLLGPGDYASVVEFDSGARQTAPMQRTTTANKSDLQNGIDTLTAGGGTDIGDGMRVAFPEFDKAPENTTKAAILLGDGIASYPNNQVQTYNNSDIPVCTIALGSNADRDTLERIAENTGCELREASSSNLEDIYNELNQNITGSSTIDRKKGTVNNNSTAKQRFRLDRSVDNTNVRVNIGSSSGSSADSSTAVTANDGTTTVRLLYPNGTAVPLNSSSPTGTDDPSITYNDLGDTTIYQLAEPEAGEWTTEIRNQQSSPVSYSSEVTASASATLSATTDGSEFVNGSATTISATLVNDQGGISGATVTANVTRPDGSTDTVQLNETSSGTYRGQVANEDDGTVSATVTAASQNFNRQASLSWSVVDQSSVLQTSVVNNTPATTAEGGSVDVAVNVTRPADSNSTSVTASTDASAETDAAESAFMAQVREVAASEPGTYDPADVDPAVLTAARALQNESNQATEASINETLTATDATSLVSATTSDSAMPVFVSASELTAPGGATISGRAVQISPSVVSLQTGAGAEVTVSVQVPDSASPGVYNGTVTAVIDGTVVQTPYTVNVTEATATTYENRIQQSASNWAVTSSPDGKSYYETQIADQLTNRYFEIDSSSESSDSEDESTSAEAVSGVDVGVVR